jgi:hypothetical protein
MVLKKGNGGAVTLYCTYISEYSVPVRDLNKSSTIMRLNATEFNYSIATERVEVKDF